MDVILGREATDAVAGDFRNAIERARFVDRSAPGRLVVTSPPPPPRTPGTRAGAMQLLLMPTWFAAVVAGADGAIAAIAATILFVTAIVLVLTRPPHMHRTLAWGAHLVAVAFVVDTLATGDLLRLAGTALAGLTGLALARLGSR